MATATFCTAAVDDLSCPVCFELLKDQHVPKQLECLHVCCAICVKKMMDDGEGTVDCPECRHITHVPEGGVDAMRTNLRLRSLAEKHEECCEHRQSTASACKVHNVPINFYCFACNLAFCSTCALESHTGGIHDVKKVSVVHEEQTEEMERLIQQVGLMVLKSEQSVNDLTALEEEINKFLTLQEQNIDQQEELAIAKVQTAFQTLKRDVRQKEQHRLDKVTCEKARLLKQAEKGKMVKHSAQEIVTYMERREYVIRHKELVQNMKRELENDTVGRVSRNPLIGMTKCTFSKPIKVDPDTFRLVQIKKCQLELFQEFGNFKWANDIVATQSSSFVICDYSAKQVYIYTQQKKGRFKGQSSLVLSSKNTTEMPNSVAVTVEGKYLVARWTHVEVYLPSGKYEGILNFRRVDGKKNEDMKASKIKVFPDGSVAVADALKSLINVVSLDGSVVRTMATRIQPWRIGITPHGHILVSDWMNNKISIMELDSGREVHAFDIPRALSLHYHEPTDCILIGRCLQFSKDQLPVAGTGVIEQYCCTSGRLVARLAEGLQCPFDMALSQTGMLAVADSKTVKIYQCKT